MAIMIDPCKTLSIIFQNVNGIQSRNSDTEKPCRTFTNLGGGIFGMAETNLNSRNKTACTAIRDAIRLLLPNDHAAFTQCIEGLHPQHCKSEYLPGDTANFTSN